MFRHLLRSRMLAPVKDKSMLHFFLLGLQVGDGVRIRCTFTGNLLDNLDAGVTESPNFTGIIREKPNAADTEVV